MCDNRCVAGIANIYFVAVLPCSLSSSRSLPLSVSFHSVFVK